MRSLNHSGPPCLISSILTPAGIFSTDEYL
nr:MAG TPA: hypothetical protein [Caudoviricetes sp.]